MLKHFPGPDNKPLSEGDLIEILVNMAPAQWRKSMVQINFEPMQKTLTEVVEYLERLEVLDATEKKKEPQKKAMISQKIMLSQKQKVISLPGKGRNLIKRGKDLQIQKPLVTVTMTPGQRSFVKSVRR